MWNSHAGFTRELVTTQIDGVWVLLEICVCGREYDAAKNVLVAGVVHAYRVLEGEPDPSIPRLEGSLSEEAQNHLTARTQMVLAELLAGLEQKELTATS